jgi:hypothetical protein
MVPTTQFDGLITPGKPCQRGSDSNESDRNKDTERQRGRNGMQKGINAPNDERTPLVLDLETTGVEEEFIRTHRMNGIPLEVKNEWIERNYKKKRHMILETTREWKGRLFGRGWSWDCLTALLGGAGWLTPEGKESKFDWGDSGM